MCKMMISPNIFLIFLKFSFLGLLGGGGKKIAQNEKQQLYVPCAISQGRYSI